MVGGEGGIGERFWCMGGGLEGGRGHRHGEERTTMPGRDRRARLLPDSGNGPASRSTMSSDPMPEAKCSRPAKPPALNLSSTPNLSPSWSPVTPRIAAFNFVMRPAMVSAHCLPGAGLTLVTRSCQVKDLHFEQSLEVLLVSMPLGTCFYLIHTRTNTMTK